MFQTLSRPSYSAVGLARRPGKWHWQRRCTHVLCFAGDGVVAEEQDDAGGALALVNVASQIGTHQSCFFASSPDVGKTNYEMLNATFH